MIDIDEEMIAIQQMLDAGADKGATITILLDIVTRLYNELELSRKHARACCCLDGTMFCDKSQFTSGFDRSDYGSDHQERFPEMSKTVCNICHGANVMVSMNERQRAKIERMSEELKQSYLNYEALEHMYEKVLYK